MVASTGLATLPGRLVERMTARRGHAHAFPRLAPPATALVVIDMTPIFISERPETAAITAVINRVGKSLRSDGGSVLWVGPGRSSIRTCSAQSSGRKLPLFNSPQPPVSLRTGGFGPLWMCSPAICLRGSPSTAPFSRRQRRSNAAEGEKNRHGGDRRRLNRRLL